MELVAMEMKVRRYFSPIGLTVDSFYQCCSHILFSNVICYSNRNVPYSSHIKLLPNESVT